MVQVCWWNELDLRFFYAVVGGAGGFSFSITDIFYESI